MKMHLTKMQIINAIWLTLKENNMNAGDEASLDHFYCSVKGRLFNSKGKTKEDICMLVD